MCRGSPPLRGGRQVRGKHLPANLTNLGVGFDIIEPPTAALRSRPDLSGHLDDPRQFAFGQIHRKTATRAGWNAGKATLR